MKKRETWSKNTTDNVQLPIPFILLLSYDLYTYQLPSGLGVLCCITTWTYLSKSSNSSRLLKPCYSVKRSIYQVTSEKAQTPFRATRSPSLSPSGALENILTWDKNSQSPGGAAATCMGVPPAANGNPRWSVNSARLQRIGPSPGFNVFQMNSGSGRDP